MTGIVHTVMIVPRTGNRVDPSCSGPSVRSLQMALWPKSLEPWLPVKWRREHLIPQPDDGCFHMPALTGTDITISGVKPGAVLTTSSDRTTLPTIVLETIGGIGWQHWYLNGVPVAKAKYGQSVNYSLTQFGQYQLAVVDEVGNTDQVAFEVINQ